MIGEIIGAPRAIGEHPAVRLIATDDTGFWGPGHADWRCERCGKTSPTSIELEQIPCEEPA